MIVNININDEPVFLLDGLTLDDLKAKYSWIFNAKIKGAVIGEQNNRIVWYFGDWIDGEWYDGIWYSGNFYKGIWENGDWFSYKLDRSSVLNGKLRVLEINNTSSIFHTGIWKNGTFNTGTFGISTSNWDNTIWENGTFSDGIFQNATWKNGNHKNGNMNNIYWENGNFYGGIFNGDTWLNGNFYGGDFKKGTWYNGTFDQVYVDITSRFGVSENLESNTPVCIWKNGTFKKGQFHSGLFKNSNGDSIVSSNHKLSIWENGIWVSGDWYGGHFIDGEWLNGYWYGGIAGSWSTEYCLPTSIYQQNVEVISGVTSESVLLPIESLSSYTYFDLTYTGGTFNELEFSGFTYTDSINDVTSFNDVPPFYFYTNFENFVTGVTGLTNDPYFESNDLFTYTGHIYMEAKSNILINRKDNVYRLDINAEIFDNIEWLIIRLLDLSGNTIGYVYETDDMIMKDYYDIRQSGNSTAFFFENFEDDGQFIISYVAKRLVFNQPFNIKITSKLRTFKSSQLISNLSGERIFIDDVIKLNVNSIFTEPTYGYNVYRYYLRDVNNNVISNYSYVTNSGNSEVYLTAHTFSDNYKLNIDIYRDQDTIINSSLTSLYDSFSSNLTITSYRLTPNVEWINTSNLFNDSNTSYTYFKDNTARNTINALIISGFSFNVPQGSEIKGFKVKVLRSGFYERSEKMLGYVKDYAFWLTYAPFRRTINSDKNRLNLSEFSIPKSYTKEEITYGEYLDFFEYDSTDWDVDKVNNNLKIVYQPQIFKDSRLSSNLNIEGRIYYFMVKVYYQTKPKWYDGVWYNGVWVNGYRYGGTFYNGTFINGEISGLINSEI